MLLHVPGGADALTAIAERFPRGLGFEDFLLDNGIEGSFWNRIGD